MSAIKFISEYIGEDNGRSASVYKDIETKEYRISLGNDAGSYFSITFQDVDSAEDYAESWVMNK